MAAFLAAGAFSFAQSGNQAAEAKQEQAAEAAEKPLESEQATESAQHAPTTQTSEPATPEANQPTESSGTQSAESATQTGEPAKTETPAQTSETSKTETPAQTGEPAKTETPAQTGEPAKTETPAQTGEPAKTETPTQTSETSKTETPAQTGEPAKTETLAQTGEATKTETPTQTSEPAKTETPTQTGEPGKTEAAAQTGEPAKTEAAAQTSEAGKTESAAQTSEAGKTESAAQTSEAGKTEATGQASETSKNQTQGSSSTSAYQAARAASMANQGAASEPGNEDAYHSSVQYMDLPENVAPLDGLLPSGGIGQSNSLMKQPKNIKQDHDIDVGTRSLEVKQLYVNPLSKDTTELWRASYPELADYVNDMYDIGLNRLWLNSLIGQKDGGYTPPETGSEFDITIPVPMPAWMKTFGFDKPKLFLQGTLDIRLKGYGEYDDAPGSTERSLFPSPSLTYDPNFMVKGKIGPYITVEINNVESGLGVQNQIRVVYEESYEGEFEDYILQRVEAGNTSLSLSGTEFTGYSENHKGLFGIKAEWKLGDWNLTTIASQDGGSQESYTINASESTTEYQIQDKSFVAYKYYFINHEARSNYISAGIAGKTTSSYAATGLKLYKRSATTSSTSTDDVLKNMTVVYTTPSGGTIEKSVERMTEISSSDYTYDSRTGIVKISGASKSTLIAASWSGDGTGRSGTTVRDGSKLVLIQWDATLSELTDIDKLMLRNVYSVGITDDGASSFVLRMKNKSGVSSNYLKILGVADTSTGSILVNDNTIFKKNSSGSYTGELWLPCKPLREYSGSNASTRARENCLEPLRNLDSSSTMAKMYDLSVSNLKRYTSQFYFEAVGKRRSSTISVRDQTSSHSVSSGACMDISPGTEKLKAGSETLVRDQDYEVNYELGQIELLSDRALDPNREITVTFECEPLFEIDNKILLGARAELPLNRYGFGDGSLFGVTALYKSQSTTATVPTLGSEPYSSFLWGVNLRLQDTTKLLTRAMDAIPFLHSKAPSTWLFETEFAASYHNTNTSSSKTAYIEDFEATTTGLTYPLSRLSWYHASPPGGVSDNVSTYIADQDYRHKGEFIWHSNTTELYKYIYPSVGDSDVDNQRLTVLKLTLRANDNLMGKSWGGIMRPNSSYYQDLSEMRYVEVVARGNVGSLYLDLGLISEDLSINGYEPNGTYDGENSLGTTTALHDRGLDGLTGSEESRLEWDCRIDGCVSTERTSANVTTSSTDIALDDFSDDYDDDSDPPVAINGTEDNSGERSYDTEDINRNGSLDTDISFVRYRIDLSSEDDTEYEELKNGWRRWRIPLDDYDTIVSSSGNDYKTILSEALFSRLWLGNLNTGVSEAKVQIVSLGVIGNEWESGTAADLYVTTSTENSQIAEVDGSESVITQTTATVDSNRLSVTTLNTREDAGTYYKSPNTTTERDAESNSVLKETALVLTYKDMKAGEELGATRVFDTDVKDLTNYKTIKMEIHYSTDADSVPVRFAIQIGEGSLDGSTDYYEWSFRPTKYECGASERVEDCHEENWLANAFALSLTDFTNMKIGRTPPYTTPTIVEVEDSDREEQLKLVGNPSLTTVDWIRFAVIADDDANPDDLEGVFWIDDLRLSGLDLEWGYAARVSGQLDFSDFATLSGTVRYQDGDFATLSTSSGSPKADLSDQAAQLDITANASFSLNKFFPDESGFHIPLALGYSSTTKRYAMKPTDDLILEESSFADLMSDMFQGKLAVTDPDEEQELRDNKESKGYQSYSKTESISISFSKDYVPDANPIAEYMSQIFLERPAFSYSYYQTEARSTTSADSTYSYRTIIEYRLGTYNKFDYKPFAPLGRFRLMKPLAETSFEPWPQTFDLTLFDLSYVRYVDQERDPDYVEPQVDKVVTFTADLTHKVNMRWNIFSFLSTSYSVNIKRDMLSDREAFVKENFFGFDDLFAADEIFDYDHTNRKVYVSADSIVAIPYDTVAQVNSSGDTMAIDMDNPDSYEILYDTTTFYRVDSLGKREYGRSYGILRNERYRARQFKVTFSPNIIVFLPMTFTYTSDFTQQRTIPDDFSYYDDSMIEKNFWTISQTNKFEFTPTFKLVTFTELFGKGNAVANFLTKWKWREVRGTWTATTNTVGENFTLAQLYEEQGVTPFQYYLYGLGIGNGYKNRGLWNIMTGDMGLTSASDYERFAQYRNANVDTLVYQGSFTHSITRTLQLSTGFTLPFWDIAITGDMQWSETVSQDREYPMYTDTTTVWPKWGVGVTIPNFSQRVGFLNGFKSVSSNHRVDYTFTRSVNPYQSTEDSWSTVWNFNPLVRLSFLLKNNMRIDNSVHLKYEYTERRPKEEVISQTNWPEEVEDVTDTTKYYYTPWIRTSLYKDYGITVGDDLTITYPLKTKRGFQLWRWFITLDNDIDLKFTAGYEFNKTIRRYYDPVSGYDIWEPAEGTTSGIYRTWTFDDYTYTAYKPKLELTERTVPSRTHEWFLRPALSYQFNKIVSTSAYIEYRQIHEKLDDETAHIQRILSFEIAMLLRFN